MWLKTENFSNACGTATLKSLPSRSFFTPHVHPRLRKRPPRCTLDCGFKTPESPALRGFKAERCPIKLTDAAISKTSAGKLVATWTDDGTTYANKDARATFYQVIDGKSYEKDSKTITLASGVTSHKLTAAAEIKQTGDYYAVIEIIDNGKVVASATTTTVGFAF